MRLGDLLQKEGEGERRWGGGSQRKGIVQSVSETVTAGLSCALFAPGWVWECAEPRSDWQERSVRLWDRLQACSYDHRPPRPTVVSLPFQSSFGRGCGLFNYSQVST